MLELNSNCFLCWNNCSTSNNRGEFKNHLITLLKYLNNFPANGENGDEIASVVEACEKCQKILRTFSHLLKSLEIAEMKVTACLKQIEEVMTNSGTPNDLSFGNIQTFKTNLIEKTSSKLKRSRFQPILKLERIKISRIIATSVSEEPFPTPAARVDIIKAEPKEEENDYDYDMNYEDDTNDVAMDIEYNIFSKVEPQEQPQQQPWQKGRVAHDDEKGQTDIQSKLMNIFHKERSQGVFKTDKVAQKSAKLQVSKELGEKQTHCPYCRANFKVLPSRCSGPNKYENYGTWMLRQHILQYHCEHYFPNKRLETVSPSDFQKIVLELLFEDLIEGRNSCAYCPRPILKPSERSPKNRHYLRIKLHYIECHQNFIQEKLRSIQTDPNLSEKLEKCNPDGITCPFCGIYCASYVSLKVHGKLYCEKIEGQDLSKLYQAKIVKELPFSETEDGTEIKCNFCGLICSVNYAREHTKYHSKGSIAQDDCQEQSEKTEVSKSLVDGVIVNGSNEIGS